jgi:hypothetical protein
MTTPTTEAGRKHLEWLMAGDDIFEEDALSAVLDIEAEAVRDALLALRAEVEALDLVSADAWFVRDVHDVLHPLVDRAVLLAAIDRRLP